MFLMSSTERTAGHGGACTPAAVEITAEERGALFEMVRAELEYPALGSAMYAPEGGALGGAHAKRRELHATLLRLYDCIGWHEADGDGRERFGITIELERLV